MQFSIHEPTEQYFVSRETSVSENMYKPENV
jgi:hypothetical protein